MMTDDLLNPLSDDELRKLGTEGETPPTLEDALESGDTAAPSVSQPEPLKAMKPEALIALIGDLSSLDLPRELALSYKKEFSENPVVDMGVRFSGICDALAKYGMGANGGSMPDWLKVTLGLAALGAGVAMTRGKYADKPNAEAFVDPGGDVDGSGFVEAGPNPISTFNFGPGTI
jgi:hypothetical protein